MLARYREVCDTVLRFRDSKEKLVRRAVISLLPRLAAFAPERFARSYLDRATEHLLGVLSVPAERGAGARAAPHAAGLRGPAECIVLREASRGCAALDRSPASVPVRPQASRPLLRWQRLCPMRVWLVA